MDDMSEQDQRIVVIGPDGSPVGAPNGTDEESGEDNGRPGIAGMVSQPDKVMRIGTMIKQLLEEVKAAPLDEASRARLRDVHASSIRELEEGLAPELREELDRLTLPFSESETPSDAELRIAQAQLVGWLEGCSTESRPHCSPSRWPPVPSWRRCAGGRCRVDSALDPTTR